MSINIDQTFLDNVARTAVEQAIKSSAASSPELRTAVQNAINHAMARVAPMIATAIDKAVADVTSKPGFLDAMIQKAILEGSSKLGGSFDASLRAAGKKLALDGDTLERVAEGIKIAMLTEAEARQAEYELRGGGQFA